MKLAAAFRGRLEAGGGETFHYLGVRRKTGEIQARAAEQSQRVHRRQVRESPTFLILCPPDPAFEDPDLLGGHFQMGFRRRHHHIPDRLAGGITSRKRRKLRPSFSSDRHRSTPCR